MFSSRKVSVSSAMGDYGRLRALLKLNIRQHSHIDRAALHFKNYNCLLVN